MGLVSGWEGFCGRVRGVWLLLLVFWSAFDSDLLFYGSASVGFLMVGCCFGCPLCAGASRVLIIVVFGLLLLLIRFLVCLDVLLMLI